MNTQEGDTERDRPRRLTELSNRMAPRAAGRSLGAAPTQLTPSWPGGRMTGRGGLPQSHIKFRVFTQGLWRLWVSKAL